MSSNSLTGVFWPGSLLGRDLGGSLRAARAGAFRHMAVSPVDLVGPSALGRTISDVAAEVRDQGVDLLYFDAVTSWAPIRFPADPDAFTRSLLDFDPEYALDIAAEAGISTVLAVGAFAPGDVPTDVLIRSFADFCDSAAKRAIRVDLEFVAIWGIPDLPLAWNIVRNADRSNAGILVDTWHLCRSTRNLESDMALLRSLPPGCVQTLQTADAPLRVQGDMIEDLFSRTLPGGGELPIMDILAAAMTPGGVKWIGPEIFGPAMTTESPEIVGRQFRDSLRALPFQIE